MEVFLEMRSGFREFDEKVKVWREKIHSLKIIPLTADFLLLCQDLVIGLDPLDQSLAILIEKYKENCSIIFFLEPLRKVLKKVQKEIRSMKDYILKLDVLDNGVRREYGMYLQELDERLETFRLHLRCFSNRLNRACSIIPPPQEEKQKKGTVKMNRQIAYFIAFLEYFAGYFSLTPTEVAKIVVLVVDCSKDYAAKTLSCLGEDYKGNDIKYTGWTYLEEARVAVKKLDKILKKLNAK